MGILIVFPHTSTSGWSFIQCSCKLSSKKYTLFGCHPRRWCHRERSAPWWRHWLELGLILVLEFGLSVKDMLHEPTRQADASVRPDGPSGRVVVSRRSRDVPTSRLGLVSRKIVNASVSGGRRLGLGHLCLVPKTNFRPNCAGHAQYAVWTGFIRCKPML